MTRYCTLFTICYNYVTIKTAAYEQLELSNPLQYLTMFISTLWIKNHDVSHKISNLTKGFTGNIVFGLFHNNNNVDFRHYV